MEYRNIGRYDVSFLGMGNMRLPVTGRIRKHIDFNAAAKIIDYAMDHGVNYYDTAYVYHGGESEAFLGKALEKYPRDSYYLATKYFLLATANYQKVFEKQLEKLKTDHVDFYLIHSIMDATANRYIKSGAIEYFMEQQQKGRIGKLGFSSHAGVKTLDRFSSHHQWDFVQLQINFRDWILGTAKREYEIVTTKGIPVVVMEPLRGGKLFQGSGNTTGLLAQAHPDWNVADWAFRWLKTLDNVRVVLSGMNSMSQIQQNVSIFSGAQPLTPSETALLLQSVSRNPETVSCTGCRYCVEGDTCPASIDIPYYMDVYNARVLNQPEPEPPGKTGLPTNCIQCGVCERLCPQSIPIPATLKKLSAR